MKSIVLFGSFTHQTTYKLSNELQSFQLAEESVSVGGPIMDIAKEFANLSFETHCMIKMGNDIASLECQDQLDSEGIFTQAISANGPMPTELIVVTPSNQYTILSSSNVTSFSPSDQLPYVSFDHCDYGLLHEFNEDFLSRLFVKTPKVKWIMNHGFPNANLLKYIHGVVLNESEFQRHSKGFSKEMMGQMMVNAGVKWIIVLSDHQVFVFNDDYEDYQFSSNQLFGIHNKLRQSFIAQLITKLSNSIPIVAAVESLVVLNPAINEKEETSNLN